MRHPSKTNIAKSFLSLLFFGFFVVGSFGQTATLPDTTTTNVAHRRFLFVIETSTEMKKLFPAARECVIELLGSSMGGQMNQGDTFGIWTFNFDLFTGGFPMQFWSTNEATFLTNRVGQFLKAQKFDHGADIEPVLRPLYAVVRSSSALTVVLLTSGSQAIRGTPFDGQINSYFTANLKEFQKKKTPFVTVLLVQNGQIVRHAVSPALGEVKIPKAPPLPAPPPVVAQTNAPVPPPAATPKNAQALIIGKGGAKLVDAATADSIVEKMKEEQAEKLAAAAKVTEEVLPPTTTPATPELAKQQPESPSAVAEPSSTQTEVTSAVVATPEVPGKSTASEEPLRPAQPLPRANSELQQAPFTPAQPTESTVAAQALSKAVSSAKPVEKSSVNESKSHVAMASANDKSPPTFLLVVLVLIFAAAIGGFFLGRKSAPRAKSSLISEAVERQGKR